MKELVNVQYGQTEQQRVASFVTVKTSKSKSGTPKLTATEKNGLVCFYPLPSSKTLPLTSAHFIAELILVN
jgi:hypothetical protein